MKLTKKQKEFLDFISNYIEEWEQSPTFDEICSNFGFSSYNTVTSYLKILERKGYIRLSGKNRKRGIALIKPMEARRFEFPLLGRVAAGKPIEAIRNRDVVELPPSMVGSGEHFVLQVEGDSMVDDGILDGDYVVVRKQSTAENGETVVAIVENEATVKRYYRTRDRVELRPAREGMKSFWFKKGNLHIEGKVVGVVRYFR